MATKCFARAKETLVRPTPPLGLTTVMIAPWAVWRPLSLCWPPPVALLLTGRSAAAAMALSSVSVIGNALRLRGTPI